MNKYIFICLFRSLEYQLFNHKEAQNALRIENKCTCKKKGIKKVKGQKVAKSDFNASLFLF